MVRGLGLGDEAFVALNEDFGSVLDLPLADVAESLAADWGLLGSLGRCPAVRPVVGELLKEWRLDARRLQTSGCTIRVWTWVSRGKARLALKTGLAVSSADALAAAQTRMAEAESATLRMLDEGPRR